MKDPDEPEDPEYLPWKNKKGAVSPNKLPKSVVDERSLHIAVYSAMDWTYEEIGDVMNLSRQAIAKHVSIHREDYDRIKAIIKAQLTPYVQKIKTGWEIKQKNRDKGHRVVGKLLDQALQDTKPVVVDTPQGRIIVDMPVEPNAVHLKAAETAIARVEGNTLDRKAVLELSMNEDNQLREVDGGKLDEILSEMQMLNNMHKQALLPAVQEAEIVDSEPTN